MSERGFQFAAITFDSMDRDMQAQAIVIASEYVEDGFNPIRASIKAITEVANRNGDQQCLKPNQPYRR